MRAAWYEQKGAAKDVINVGETNAPEPGDGEVLVRVHLSGVNPSDTKNRSGWAGGDAMPFPRVILHQDGAGVIEAVGAGVPASRVGERVWIYEATWRRASGTAAEYTVVPDKNAVRLPDGVDFATGASLGVPAMTAHRCLFADGSIEDQTILVAGGAGAVGHSAIQLAKWGGARRVIATVSTGEQAEIARAAGADHVINYKTEDVAARVKEVTGGQGSGAVDRVVEVAFVPNMRANLALLKPNGTISTYESGGERKPKIPFYELLLNGITVHFVLVYVMSEEAHEAAIRDINACLEDKALRPRIARCFPLSETIAAHEAVEGGKTNGKVIIEIN